MKSQRVVKSSFLKVLKVTLHCTVHSLWGNHAGYFCCVLLLSLVLIDDAGLKPDPRLQKVLFCCLFYEM